ncbi:MAG TPA: class I SAM-dependent methyltransferase [Thermoleophilaceae bacterium]|nr:class I SAM-dependent methyltransferase [Thermoleophilaceae bacterium]
MEQREVYERHYSAEGDDARRYGAWRELCAAGKADHVVALLEALPRPPRSVIEVGCGDGVLLAQLAGRGVGEARHGFDLSERAVAYAASRPEVDLARAFDGHALPVPDDAYDLGILSHVLEHVPDPLPLLRETARAARALVVEVPLEDNLSASRGSASAGREAIGHLHRFSRADVSRLASAAGLHVVADIADPLPLAVHSFFAGTPAENAKALAKTAARRAVFAAAPARAERLFTVHYAALCLPSTTGEAS